MLYLILLQELSIHVSITTVGLILTKASYGDFFSLGTDRHQFGILTSLWKNVGKIFFLTQRLKLGVCCRSQYVCIPGWRGCIIRYYLGRSFFLNIYIFWDVDWESEIRFWGAASEIRFFPIFCLISNIKRQWRTREESRVLGGEGEAQY